MHNQLKQQLKKDILIRPRIARLFQETENKPLVEVIADAGYGKTQSVLSYVSDIDACVLWVSLKQMDNFSPFFWDSFCDSLDTMNHELAVEFKKNGFPEDYTYLYQFNNAFTKEVSYRKRVILVFDEYHLLVNSAITDFIHNIISMNIKNLTVFLLSRTDFYFPNNLPNKKNSIYKITNEDLAFTLDEVNECFLKLNTNLPYRTIKDIYQKTEGWPIAISLLSLSISEHPQNENLQEQSTKSAVYEIIEKEIFSKHSLDRQKILVKLSFFDSFSIRFIENLTPIVSDKILIALFSNLLVRYNPHIQAYQFHQVFRSFLKEKTFMLSEQEIRETYQIAGEWFKNQKFKAEALDCFLKFKDYDSVWSIIIGSISERSRASADGGRGIMEIMHASPDSFIKQNPMTRIVYGLAHSWCGDFKGAVLEFKRIIEEFKAMDKNQQVKEIIGEAYVLLGLHYMLFGNTAFYECFKSAYDYLPEGSHILGKQWMVLNTGDAITLKHGEPHEMEQWVQTLEEAIPYLEHLLNKSTCGFELVAKAEASYYQGNIDDAEKFAYQAIYRGKEESLVDIVCNSYYILCKIAIFRGDCQKTLELLELSEAYHEKYNTEVQYNIPEIAEGFFYIRAEQFNQVPGWIINGQDYISENLFVGLVSDYVIMASCMLMQKKFHELAPFLDKTETLYKAGNQYIQLIHVYIIKAIVYRESGDDKRLLEAFTKAYEMSCENKIVMPFVEYGRYMKSLIQYIRNNLKHEIPEQWLAVVNSKSSAYARRLKYIRSQYKSEYLHLIDENTLSKAQTDILIALSQGMTREEIAENTNTSQNTVKSQIKNIYSKLGAVNGMHAVRIAIGKGIIRVDD